MKTKHLATLAVTVGIVAAATVLLLVSVFKLDEAEQAVILQFGKPVGDLIDSPGLHLKIPFIQEVRRFDKRILVWDGSPNQIPTRGREFISIDTTARWRIVNPLQFLQSVRDEIGAQSRLDDIIDSVVRDMISSTELVEIVRSGDWDVSIAELETIDTATTSEQEDELTRQVSMGREQLINNILAKASEKMPERYGIELVDVQIKRLNYIPSVRQQVFNRMITERQRIAEQFRSQGQGEASRIRGQTSQQLAVIRSEANRKAEIIRGEADAEATRIYNEAYTADPEFYKFSQTLESYARSLSKQTVLVIGTNSEYFQYFRNINAAD